MWRTLKETGQRPSEYLCLRHPYWATEVDRAVCWFGGFVEGEMDKAEDDYKKAHQRKHKRSKSAPEIRPEELETVKKRVWYWFVQRMRYRRLTSLSTGATYVELEPVEEPGD